MFTMMSTSELEEETLVRVVDYILEDSIVREFLSVGRTTDEVVLSKLGSTSSPMQRAALNVFGSFLKYAELCNSIAKIAKEKKIFDKIGSLLMHSHVDTQEAALKAIFASSANEETHRLIMSTGQIVTDIIGLLDHGRLSISELAFDTVGLMLNEDHVVNTLSSTETMFKLLQRLGSNELSLRERAFKILKKIVGNARVNEILLTKKCILQLFEMLHGRDEDQNVLGFVDELVKALDGNFAAIGTAFIHQPLKRLAEPETSANTSDSYIQFIKKLPREYQVSSDDTLTLISLLSESNSVIVNRAGALVQHFAYNAAFRQRILDRDVWAKSLQTDDANLVVDILTEFAKASGKERLEIPHGSGIMAQLLSMTKADVDNVGRWKPGWNGLLALGVFSSDEEMAEKAEKAKKGIESVDGS
ncbi:hypothetical protein R3P38DRAFT_2933581 [Favolaschia claudopus]|uniref:Uncharacterized protein n=1 Tax=Favolaschia claudopus TaxID=2862362 RepID=A0AAW0BVV6_9AGAR